MQFLIVDVADSKLTGWDLCLKVEKTDVGPEDYKLLIG